MLTTRTRLKVLTEITEENDEVSSCVKTADELKMEDIKIELDEKMERRRKNITDELFETEKTYLYHLDLAHKFFEFPLRFNCLISERSHSLLFSNLEQILEVNTKLLEHMEQTTVGTAFKFLGPFLKLYSMYASNHQQALATLQENIQKNDKFADFVREQEERCEMMGLKLGALLITPVQRIPRYKLLLEDLLHNTNPEHHDYLQLKEAAKQVGEIATHINEHLRQHANFQKMLTIQNSFDNSAPKILAPGREFIKEGKLNKISRRRGRVQERMFFMFSDMIMYAKPKLLDGGSNFYSCCCVLPLRHCQVERVLGSVQRSDGGGMFKITCKEESLLLYCTDTEQVVTWVESLEGAIRKLNLNRQTLRKPSSNKVPVRGKSLTKMKLKEHKYNTKKNKSQYSSHENSMLPFGPLTDIDFCKCLTPPKRPKQDSSKSDFGKARSLTNLVDSSHHGCNDEICLDTWSPSQMPASIYSNYKDEAAATEENEDNITGIIIENPPYTDYNVHYHGEQHKNSHTNDYFNYTNTNVRFTKEASEEDCNSKFPKNEDSVCSSWSIRRVLQSGSKIGSSFGSAIDRIRTRKNCSVM